MMFHPSGDRTLLRLENEQTTMESGIVIPESAKDEYPAMGTVIAVGPTSTYAVGSRVLFAKFAGDDVELDGIPYKVVPEESVLGTFID